MTDESRLDSELSRVHLQWFADGDEGGGEDTEIVSDDGEKDVETRLKELENALAQTKKESAGKDSKISKLLKAVEQQDQEKQKREQKTKRSVDYSRMDPDQLISEIEKVREEAWEKAEKIIEEERSKGQENQFKFNIVNAIPKIENLDPNFAAEILKLMLVDKNADEDDVQNAIQSFANTINNVISKNRIIFDNRSRTSHLPQSGDSEAIKVPSKSQWYKWNEIQQRKWLSTATDEEMNKVNNY